MKQYKFQTNINCGGCVAKVTPHLQNNDDITSWHVDTTASTKTLTIETNTLLEVDVKAIVENAGFKAEPMHS